MACDNNDKKDSCIIHLKKVTNDETHFDQTKINSSFEFQAITYKIKKKKSESKYILKDICGRFYPGRMVAILGPSGAGKTSLIKILSGTRGNGITGQIYLNGEEWLEEKHKNFICHIRQDFVAFGELTIYETMMIAARLNIKQRNEQRLRVEKVLNILNLLKCQHTYVNKISGGELKRLSIGVELITNPPIMFLDEPTSGLDSFTAFHLIEHVKQLSRTRVIVCVIHQPNSQLLELFDDIMLLSQGQNIYYDSLDNLVPYFDKSGFTCPAFYNRADFVIEIAFKVNQEKLNEFVLNAKKMYTSTNISKLASSSKNLNKDVCDDSINEESILLTNEFKYLKSHKIDNWKILMILLERSLKITFRNKYTAPFQIASHICVALITGLLYYNIGKDASTIFSNWSNLFFAIIFVFSVNSFSSVLTFPCERKIFLREHNNNWYSTTSYFFSKILTKLPLLLITPTIFIIIVYFLTGQPYEIVPLLKFWLVIFLDAVLGDMYGNLIGVVFNIQLGICAAPTFFIPMLLFSGFFIRIIDIPNYLQWITNISYCKLSFEALMIAIYDTQETLPCKAVLCYYRYKEHFFQDLGLNVNNYYYDILGLLLWIISLLLCCLSVLIIRTKKFKSQ